MEKVIIPRGLIFVEFLNFVKKCATKRHATKDTAFGQVDYFKTLELLSPKVQNYLAINQLCMQGGARVHPPN